VIEGGRVLLELANGDLLGFFADSPAEKQKLMNTAHITSRNRIIDSPFDSDWKASRRLNENDTPLLWACRVFARLGGARRSVAPTGLSGFPGDVFPGLRPLPRTDPGLLSCSPSGRRLIWRLGWFG
jgi:hypothetical protein